ncbi:hypothetical protein AB6A40_008158 [Gnathostoma spinigerum]|uniref:Copper transport protein n=1 Tax=Gnathostoma spinigerum TaxID=75299 RepID=A0ABD6EN89_9BILA
MSHEHMHHAMNTEGNHIGDHDMANHDMSASDGSVSSMDAMHMMGSHSMSMASMSFHFGVNEILLFPFFHVTSASGIVLACFAIVLLCFILEGTRCLRTFQRSQVKIAHLQQHVNTEQTHSEEDSKWRIQPLLTVAMCADSFLHALILTIAYFLMLLFMTFNVWICLAVVAGEVIARLFFRVLIPAYRERATESTCSG